MKPRLRTNRAAAVAVESVAASGGAVVGGVVAGGSGTVVAVVEGVELGRPCGAVVDDGALVAFDDDSVVEGLEVGADAVAFNDECELHPHIASAATAAPATRFHTNADCVIRIGRYTAATV